MIKNAMEYNEDFKLDWHDPDEATDGYQLKWIGKDYARLQTGTATETVIIPDIEHNEKEENKNSENLFFTGDNLDVLKHLQNAYANSIKMIYIDPPYNTGSEFVYPDSFNYSDKDLKDMLGMTDDEIKRLHTINGRSSHSAWLTFMYPRLKIAKKLLADDGVIFISIDDNEIPELTKEDSEAKKHGYNTIDEISRKRIELASKKIKEETNADIDYGFKHYYVKNTEVKTINKIVEFNPETNFIGNEDMIREFDNDKSKGEDVILTTWLVDDGYKLDIKPEIKDICGYKAYYIDNSTLYLISPDWSTEQTKELLNLVGNNKLNLNTIIIYGYSFNKFENLKELETNIKQNLNKTINIEKRY